MSARETDLPEPEVFKSPPICPRCGDALSEESRALASLPVCRACLGIFPRRLLRLTLRQRLRFLQIHGALLASGAVLGGLAAGVFGLWGRIALWIPFVTAVNGAILFWAPVVIALEFELDSFAGAEREASLRAILDLETSEDLRIDLVRRYTQRRGRITNRGPSLLISSSTGCLLFSRRSSRAVPVSAIEQIEVVKGRLGRPSYLTLTMSQDPNEELLTFIGASSRHESSDRSRRVARLLGERTSAASGKPESETRPEKSPEESP